MTNLLQNLHNWYGFIADLGADFKWECTIIFCHIFSAVKNCIRYGVHMLCQVICSRNQNERFSSHISVDLTLKTDLLHVIYCKVLAHGVLLHSHRNL